MITDLIELYQLAFSSYVYIAISGYDHTYKELVDNTKGRIDLNKVQHRKFIIKWLNSWGCRQFAIEYHDLASKSILEWYNHFSKKITPLNKNLLTANEQNIKDICKSYEALSLDCTLPTGHQISYTADKTTFGGLVLCVPEEHSATSSNGR